MNKLPKKPRNENMYKAILTLRDVDEEALLREARADFLSSATASASCAVESAATESVVCPHTCCSKSDNCFSIRFCSFAIALSVLQ